MSKYLNKPTRHCIALIAVFFSVNVLADQMRSKLLQGCYNVLSGHYAISKAVFNVAGMESPREIGMYSVVMKKQTDKNMDLKHESGRYIFLKGPLLGWPFDQATQGFLTRHIMGTFNRIGTVTSNEGEFIIDKPGCLDASGNPQSAHATEEMLFDNAIGTGVFQNIRSGRIVWKGFVNGCDDPANRVADFEVLEGELCFD